MCTLLKGRVFLLLTALMITACAASTGTIRSRAFLYQPPRSSTWTNLSPAYLELTPTISVFQDPDANQVRPFRTFSVFPYSAISAAAHGNEIEQKQLLFFLRNCFEAKGYDFVALDGNPDFVVTVDASSTHHEVAVPPQTVPIPVFVPGTLVTTTALTTSVSSWGTYTGLTTAVTNVPGYVTTQPLTLPGQLKGFEVPTVAISAFEWASKKRIWIGTGAGTSWTPDVRLSSQLVVRSIVDRFPFVGGTLARQDALKSIGVEIGIFTAEGNTYMPTVLAIADDSPAFRAGLRPDDMFRSIQGQNAQNRSFSEVVSDLTREPDATLHLQVMRDSSQRGKFSTRLIEVDVIRSAQRTQKQ